MTRRPHLLREMTFDEVGLEEQNALKQTKRLKFTTLPQTNWPEASKRAVGEKWSSIKIDRKDREAGSHRTRLQVLWGEGRSVTRVARWPEPKAHLQEGDHRRHPQNTNDMIGRVQGGAEGWSPTPTARGRWRGHGDHRRG
ncbi:hypothetical protein FNV43_RR18395 [Rhamnella rubrinervis]|uniref:Uncharacterized protein n=1 Tax=Rhamnella rubrinervis TaxID=2594499 RepID=A0A8K0DYY1_9ROSA|nr:hypothetical protein FNV43_RR18395 [Rhamnella rubrinervis]